MNRDKILQIFIKKKVKDYSYTILFFITFSFFILVVIKPNLTTVFNLQKELDNLKLIDEGYNNVIEKIVNIQAQMESSRADLHVLDEGMPASPQVNKLLEDVKNVASSSGVLIDRVIISQINLKDESNRKDRRKITIDFSSETDFEATTRFIKTLLNQRRLKSINKIIIGKDSKFNSSSSAQLNLQLEIEAYYL